MSKFYVMAVTTDDDTPKEGSKPSLRVVMTKPLASHAEGEQWLKDVRAVHPELLRIDRQLLGRKYDFVVVQE